LFVSGYIIIQDLLSPAQLQLWRDVFDQAVKERGKNRFHHEEPDHTNDKVDPDYYDNVCDIKTNLSMA
jgi:hypothetical protein